jgi:hypothetical protein
LGHAATLRFLSPLIEPDMQISRVKCGAPHLMGNVASAFMWPPALWAPSGAENWILNAT